MLAKTILVVVDPTRPQQELMIKVLRVARANAQIELFVCDDEGSAGDGVSRFSGYEAAREALRKQRLRALEDLARPLRDAGHSVTTYAVWCEPLHEGIVRRAREAKPDLVVKEARRHVPVARSVYIHTDHHLVAECPAPLLLVRPEPWPAEIAVAAAVDPCRPAERSVAIDREVLTAASDLATALKTTFSVVHVTEEGSGKTVNQEEVVRALISFEVGGAVPVEFLSGDPAVALSSRARGPGATILVMGAAARARPRQTILGGFASRVLEIHDTTVLVVKHPGTGGIAHATSREAG